MTEHEPSKAEILKQVENAKDELDKIPSGKVRGAFAGFVDFVRQQGVVGLAVGFVLGVAAKGVVDSVVNNVVNPVVGVLYGGGGQLAEKYWCIKHTDAVCTSKLGYGAVLSQLINFLIVAGVVYFIVKSLRLDKLDKKKE